MEEGWTGVQGLDCKVFIPVKYVGGKKQRGQHKAESLPNLGQQGSAISCSCQRDHCGSTEEER